MHVSPKEKCELLKSKLIEEVEEFLQSNSLEELADILEVVEALGKCLGAEWGELMQIKEVKKRERGGFEEGWVMLE